MDINKLYYLQLLRTVIRGESVPEPYDGVDWHEVYLFATEQSQFSLFFDAVSAVKNQPDEDVMNRMQLIYMSHLKRDLLRENAMSDIVNHFEREHIKCMGLKGYVIRLLYPKTVYRYLSDFDLLCSPEHFSHACEVLESMGYTQVKDDPHHTVFAGKILVIELHKQLFVNSYAEYFGIGFEKAHKSKNYNFVFEQSNEDFYIYFISHAASHFKHSGIGLRTVTDLYLFLRKYHTDLNFEYIGTELDKLGLRKFSDEFIILSKYIFENAEKSELTDELLEVVTTSNTSGNIARESQFKAAKAGNKHIGLIKSFFPNYEYLTYRYTWLRGRRILVPLAWIKRFFDILKDSKRRQRINESISVTADDVDKVRGLLDKLEIK